MKEIQEKIKKFCKENNLNCPIEHRTLDLISEVGELSKEILKMSDYGTKPIKPREEITSEIGDVLFSLTILANQLNIDLEKALNLVLEKYKKRLKKGSAGSENE